MIAVGIFEANAMSAPGDEAKQLAKLFSSRADHPSVTADRLAGTADAVADLESAVVSHLVDDEEPKFCFESHADGMGIDDPDDTVDPERGGIFLFTDFRVYLQLGLVDGDKALSLPYESISSADFHQGMRRHRVELTFEGTTYYLWIPSSFDRDAVSRAVEYATYRRKQLTPDNKGGTSDDNDSQSVRERLERLGDAKSRGLIDEEEYQRRKEELLQLEDEE